MPVYSTNVFPLLVQCNACRGREVDNKVGLGFGVMSVAGWPPCLIGRYAVDMSHY